MKKNGFITFLSFFAILFVLCFSSCQVDKPHVIKPQESLEGKLLILQAYGTGNSLSPAVSHSFIELYNNSGKEINLNGFRLWYADGRYSEDEDFNETKDKSWKYIELTGNIPDKSSFLILGAKTVYTDSRLKIADGYGDINTSSLILSNRAFKVVLINGSAQLNNDIQNPFKIDSSGKKVEGYVDMAGARNTVSDGINSYDTINGYETAPARNSASEAIRRRSLTDTDNNSIDFIAARYAASGFTDEEIEVRKPRNAKNDGPWDPFGAPPAPPETKSLMIFQVFGTLTIDDSAPTHNFIELYNNSDASIDVSGYSVHYASGKSANQAVVSPWTKINLTGTIPAKSSYLILGKQVVTFGQAQTSPNNGNLDFTGTFVSGTATTPDLSVPTFEMSNRSYKVALMSNQDNITAANPWGNAACLDLVSAINRAGDDSIDAAKGPEDLISVNAATGGVRTISKQKSFRRTSLNIRDITLTDFATKQYSSLSADDIVKFRPRTTASGPYTPEF